MKHGYKQTEAGRIPDDWELKLLPTVCRFRSGKAHEKYIAEGGRYVCVNSKFISTEGVVRKFSTVNFCPAKKGDVLMVMSDLPNGRALAKAYLVEADDVYAVNQRVCALSVYRDSSEYLFYILNRNPYFLKFDNGVSQTHLLNHVFQKCPLPIPPNVSEQRAIAEALTDIDALLGGLDRLIAKKRDLKQAAMQQLLTGRTRLPGFEREHPRFVETTLGRFPEDWELTAVSSLIETNRGIRYGIVQPGEYDPNGRFMIRGQDYSAVNGWAKPHDIFRVSHLIESRYQNARVKAGDLIMTIVGYCGHVEMVPEWLEGANLTQTTARIAIDGRKANGAFCKYLFSTPVGLSQVAANMKGAAQPGLNCGDIERFVLPLPTIAEQTAIAEVLSDMDAEIAALEQRREKTRMLKQAMMQELLTGRIRLV